MTIATHPETVVHRCDPAGCLHEALPLRCEGCARKTGPDDFIRTTTGRTAICASCWEKWRRSGFGRHGWKGGCE